MFFTSLSSYPFISIIMSENTPKISVIVPVYKAEAYLHRCVDSILAQTFQDFEVLLVDDGSPDRSGEICDEYARKDKRVRVFHKENGGVSSARQCGMDNAQGEYTIHADPDDWVEPDMLKELYQKAEEEDADMVICDYYYDEAGSSSYKSQKPSSLNHEVIFCEMFRHLHGSSWNKLVRGSIYKQFGIRFPEELSYCEDLYVNACLLIHPLRVVYLPKAFYHYDQYTNATSLVRRPWETILLQERILYRLSEKNFPAVYFQQISRRLLSSQAYLVLHVGKSYLDTFQDDYRELKDCLAELELAFKTKLLYWVAFHISPRFSYNIAHLFSRLKG